jgi:hypothetical protein
MAMTSQQINEKYTKHYIELLKQNLNDQILNNISLKASVKVGEEAYQELQQEFQQNLQALESALEEKQEAPKVINTTDVDKKELEQLRINNDLLQKQINELHSVSVNYNRLNSEYHAMKSQMVNADILRKQLEEKEKIIGELETQLQQSKSFEKKPKVKKAIEVSSSPPKVVLVQPQTIVEDGGNF